jgi:hypothetical protein
MGRICDVGLFCSQAVNLMMSDLMVVASIYEILYLIWKIWRSLLSFTVNE